MPEASYGMVRSYHRAVENGEVIKKNNGTFNMDSDLE